ncbi:hypothetical protein COB21_01835 [Candidatus Aerophobetes bacterium]|uniref:ATP-grasp domain-containing protein n=1 Tax=Aerophobetes bacterium TaxID=2030807 RepID=A0A2A4X7M2_UNCAE|nr:MAG: hypothetical protein COB21_01835 [Candidatus Aerophobetes bacterium]
MPAGKNILLSGTRHSFALDLARLLSKADHTVFSVETTKHHPSAYSNAIERNFVISKPRVDINQYIQDLVSIIIQHKIDLFIPLFEEILFISEHKDYFPQTCTLFFPDFDVLDSLNNKWLFNQKLLAYNITAPKSKYIQKDSELSKAPLSCPYILKPCYSRAAQNIYRLTPTSPIPKIHVSLSHPWIAQETIEGEKFCSYTICHAGKIHAHVTYPVTFALDNSSCVRFTSIHHKAIEAWVKNFVELEKFSGQIAFDFIETSDGTLYPIECNPRATSGLHLFTENDHIDQAFLGENKEIIRPLQGISKQIAAGMLLVMVSKKHRSQSFLHVFKNFMVTKDVIFNSSDLKPFLYQPYLFLSYLLQSAKERKSIANWFIQDSNWERNSKKSIKESSLK